MAPRILVVDDNQELLQLLTQLFEDAGYEVVSAGKGRAAVQVHLNTPLVAGAEYRVRIVSDAANTDLDANANAQEYFERYRKAQTEKVLAIAVKDDTASPEVDQTGQAVLLSIRRKQ